MTDKDVATEDEKNVDIAEEEKNTTDTNDTLTSNVLHEIYGKEVFKE
jgi:hypothetical protein